MVCGPQTWRPWQLSRPAVGPGPRDCHLSCVLSGSRHRNCQACLAAVSSCPAVGAASPVLSVALFGAAGGEVRLSPEQTPVEGRAFPAARLGRVSRAFVRVSGGRSSALGSSFIFENNQKFPEPVLVDEC